MKRIRTLIMGAAGRDFHNFNTLYRADPTHEVVAFTATQIPFIDNRPYPAALAGRLYPEGIPIFPEKDLVWLLKNKKVDKVVFSYSDVHYKDINELANLVVGEGVEFAFPKLKDTMLESSKPVIAVCAVRTGCGKSQTTRKVASLLRDMGNQIAVVRHPMPYGDLAAQAVQRYESMDDLRKHKCSIEEVEEYEPHLAEGHLVFAGVDYERILRAAEREADIILWDGGNNDIPFFKPNVLITVFDPYRPGHENYYYPGKFNAVKADIAVINKEDSAPICNIARVRRFIQEQNPGATVIDADSKISADNPDLVVNKRVLVVEDGPTLTHGEMPAGAGTVFALHHKAAEIVDPREYAVGSIKDVFVKYPKTGALLPAMGYNEEQRRDLEETIRNTPCDVVVIGTPIDLARHIKIDKPHTRVRYDLEERDNSPKLKDILKPHFG